ncbi:hypothetical protein ACLMJK_001394 [Lecanora helva]
MLQLLIHSTLGYLLHPAIDLPRNKENLRVADVGTGTGLWLGELSASLSRSAHLDGFDISPAQFPPSSWYGDNVSLSTLDIFKPLPEGLKGGYDVVHLRYFMTIARDDTIRVVLENLRGMLKPGGYIQWVERDWLSKFPTEASETDDVNTQLNGFLQRAFPSTNWITTLPAHFTQTGLSVVAEDRHAPLPMYRQAWNQDQLNGTREFGEGIRDVEERKRFFEVHERAVAEAGRGWCVEWELIVCVGRKEG